MLCACDFLSHMRMLTRGCFLTQGAVLASAVAVGAAVSLSISRSRVLTPIFAVVTVSPVVTTPSAPTLTMGPTAISLHLVQRPSLCIYFDSCVGSVGREEFRPTSPTLTLCRHFQLLTLKFIDDIDGIDGKVAPSPSIPTIPSLPSLFFSVFALRRPPLSCTHTRRASLHAISGGYIPSSPRRPLHRREGPSRRSPSRRGW